MNSKSLAIWTITYIDHVDRSESDVKLFYDLDEAQHYFDFLTEFITSKTKSSRSTISVSTHNDRPYMFEQLDENLQTMRRGTLLLKQIL